MEGGGTEVTSRQVNAISGQAIRKEGRTEGV